MSIGSKNTKATTMPKATTNTKEDATMSTTIKNRPACYTKAAWEADTFRVYTGLIKLVELKVTMPQFINHPTVKDLFAKAMGVTTPEGRYTQTVNLIISMAKDRTYHGEKERHVLPIANLRKFFNGGATVKASLPVTHAEPKAPKEPAKKAAKTKTAKKAPAKQEKHEVYSLLGIAPNGEKTCVGVFKTFAEACTTAITGDPKYAGFSFQIAKVA